MNKKKLNIPKSKISELKGFEDVLDLIGIDKQEIHKKEKKSHESYELYDFLERETKRLQTLDNFFDAKVSNISKYSGQDKLIETQRINKSSLQDNLIHKISQNDSYLNDFLGKNFNLFFDSKK